MSTVCGLIIFPLLTIACFELSRVYLASQQLQNATDAAALTAVAQLASQDIRNPTQAHTDAMQAALSIFRGNSVLGSNFNNVTIESSKTNLHCSIGEAKLVFEFINPKTKQVEPLSSPDGKVARVTSQCGCATAFGRYIGLNEFNVSAIADGAVPMLDLVLCFDVSGSMDDQTPVTAVTRAWDGTLNRTTYTTTVGANGPMAGKLFDIIKPAPTGSSFNGTEPQGLTDGYFNSRAYFSEWIANFFGVPGLRSGGVVPEEGKPPGNYPPGTAPTSFGYPIYSDVVVNIDGHDTFAGFSYAGYSFPDIATLVEASRGNLESMQSYKDSKSDTALSVTPRAGYRKAYEDAAMSVLQPLQDSKDAALLFNDIMNTNTDCHFSFVAFDSQIGSAATTTEIWNRIDWQTPYGTLKGFPLPMIELDPSPSGSNYTGANNALSSCVAMGGTNIGAALHQAVSVLKNHSRRGAVKAIVLFTDGQPTDGLPLDSDPWINARKAAVEAKQEGIAIYTIGLAQNPAIVPGEIAILNDTNSNPSTGGVAAIAGNGGTFNLVTDSKHLRVAFEKIARRLVELVTFQ